MHNKMHRPFFCLTASLRLSSDKNSLPGENVVHCGENIKKVSEILRKTPKNVKDTSKSGGRVI